MNSGSVVALEFLASPLALGVGNTSADVVELGRDDPPHDAVVDGEGDDIGDDLDTNDISRRQMKIVADLIFINQPIIVYEAENGANLLVF